MRNILTFLAFLLLAAGPSVFAQTISGHLGVCLGASRTTLSISTSGGAWSSGDVTKATIDAGTGEVTGVAAGTATISYTIAPATVFTAVVTVNAVSLSSIGFSTGPGYLCTGGSPVTCTVSPMSGNAWSSSNTAVATVNSGGLVVPTSTAGTSIITYHHGAGNCNVTEVVSVYPTPTVSLSSPMCNAASQTATATPGGGTWASSNTSVATINSSTGDMTGHAGGSTNINYVSTNGCRKLTLLSVANLPGTISGTLTTCMGSTTTLSSTTSGGIWSTGTPSVATIGAGTGIVTPVSAGTADITYTAGTGCVRTAIVTINAALTSNTGNALVCVGQSTSLSNPTSGGTWSSSATSKATVGYYSGNVNAISAGTANITYSIAGGCRAITEVTVNGTMAAISGTTSVCVGETTTLNHAISGGTWSSSNTTSATVDMTSGLVSGVAPGYSIITYTVSSGCYKTTVVYVRALPAGISGTTSLCPGAGTILTDGTTGGTWSSSNTAIATIGATNGLLIGVAAGTTTISYLISSTGCFTTTIATVGTGTDAGTVIGASSVAVGATTTLSNAVSGGTWSSSNTGIAAIGTAGIVTGVAAGTATITYSVSNSCGTATATFPLTVNTTTVAPITGTLTVCSSATTTLSSATSGGTWSSGNTSIATIGSTSGVAVGVAPGTTIITYSASGITVTAVLTVQTAPATAGTVTGDSVYVGGTITLSSTVSGGTWTSSNTSVAMVGSSTGSLSGVATGTATITYTCSNGCGSVFSTVNVFSLLPSITGTFFVCKGSTNTLTNAAGGGIWTSSNTAVAIVGSISGNVTGMFGGTALISYTVGTDITTTTVTVDWAPPLLDLGGAVATFIISVGDTMALSASPGAGTWSSTNSAIATIGTNAEVIAVSPGTTTISYVRTTSCGSAFYVRTVTVSTLPPITGSRMVCQASTTTLSNAATGGTWSKTPTSAVININASTGVVSGMYVGRTIVTYTLGGNVTTAVVTVAAAPTAASWYNSYPMSIGQSRLLSAMTGGTWTSSNPTVASIGTDGVVTGVSAGTARISHTVTNSCGTWTNNGVITISSLPTITGTTEICVGGTTTLNNTYGGGTWSSSVPLCGSVNPTTGVVTGVADGITNISYHAGGSITAMPVRVYAPPSNLINLSGPSEVYFGKSITLATTIGGGSWTTSASGIVNFTSTTVSSSLASGISVTPVTCGTVDFTYTIPNACADYTAVKTITAGVSPITGALGLCPGVMTMLASATNGGTWSSSNTSVATVHPTTGVVTSVALGTTTISYMVSGCAATALFTVSSAAGTISGGDAELCLGSYAMLTDTAPGGWWESSDTAVCEAGFATGEITGKSSGTVTITHTLGAGCETTKIVTVNAIAKPDYGCFAGSHGHPIDTADVGVLNGDNLYGVWVSGDAYVKQLIGPDTVYKLPFRPTLLDTIPSPAASFYVPTQIVIDSVIGAGSLPGYPSNWQVVGVRTTLLSYQGCAWTISGGCYEGSGGFFKPDGDVTSGEEAHDKKKEHSKLEIFPNPTTGNFNVISDVSGTASVLSLDGRELMRHHVVKGSNNISFPYGAATGLYLLRFTDDDGNMRMMRLVYQP
jgi:trimeric autotransporter adhesin